MRRIGSQSGAALEGEGHRQKLRDRFDALRRMHAKAKSWSARSLSTQISDSLKNTTMISSVKFRMTNHAGSA
jgi:hypothetical protein